MPKNFRVFIDFNLLNETTGQLELWREAHSYQQVDSDGNRELTAIIYTLDNQTTRNESYYFNCSTGTVTKIVPELQFCQYIETNITLDLGAYIERATDPDGGITTYLGEVQLPYAEGTYYHFQQLQLTDGQSKVQQQYWNKESGSLNYITNEGSPFVFSTRGLIPTTFSWQDYMGFDDCYGYNSGPVLSDTTPFFFI